MLRGGDLLAMGGLVHLQIEGVVVGTTLIDMMQ